MDIAKINTLGTLKKSGYTHKTVKEEIRRNLIKRLQQKEATFPGIIGYEDTVIPETERALLSRHNILFLGLRGQAKTRMARQMTELLDEYIPVVAGSSINNDARRRLDLVKSVISAAAQRYGAPDLMQTEVNGPTVADWRFDDGASLKIAQTDSKIFPGVIVIQSAKANHLSDFQ